MQTQSSTKHRDRIVPNRIHDKWIKRDRAVSKGDCRFVCRSRFVSDVGINGTRSVDRFVLMVTTWDHALLDSSDLPLRWAEQNFIAAAWLLKRFRYYETI